MIYQFTKDSKNLLREMSETQTSPWPEPEENEIILIVTDSTSTVDFEEHLEQNTRSYTKDDSVKKGAIEDRKVESNQQTYSYEELQDILTNDNPIQQNSDENESEDIKISVPSASKLLQCKYCSNNFASTVSLINHEKCHTGNNLLYCKFCFKCFFKNSELKQHLRIHKEDEPYSSLKASKDDRVTKTAEGFKSKLHQMEESDQTDEHMHGFSNISSEEQDDIYECTVCPKKFKYKNSLRTHLDVHTRNVHQCPICLKIITTKGWFEQHLKIHGDARPYQCSVCKKRYPDEKRLQRHEYIHGTKIFKCSMCVAEFPHKYLLLDHNKIHLTGSEHCNSSNLKVLHSRVKLKR